MPYVPYRVRPLPTGRATPPPMRAQAPLASQATGPVDLPAVPETDILDFPMPDAPVRADRPTVPFAAPRRRERTAHNPLLPRISMKTFTMSPATAAQHLFPESE